MYVGNRIGSVSVLGRVHHSQTDTYQLVFSTTCTYLCVYLPLHNNYSHEINLVKQVMQVFQFVCMTLAISNIVKHNLDNQVHSEH